ncbi:MAG: iron-siderophore ABC transporter substrate-binding protein [Chloroflexales bacterium]|nr:iron-siderophore ABC transporter substrate-binding protein [Chloroflexales bacterium]
MKYITHLLPTLFAATLLLVACGPAETTNSEMVSPTSDGAAAEATTAPQAESATDETAASDNGCDEGFRLFGHEMLATDPVCIPADPQRIATIEPFSTETYLAMDVPLVAMRNIPSLLSKVPELESKLEGVIDTNQPVNLETLLTADPDLIIGLDGSIDIYEELSAIAPTVLFAFGGSGEWKDVSYASAEAIGMSDEIDAIFAEYDQRVAALRETLGDNPPVVSVIRAYPDAINLYLRESFPGTVMEDAGIPRPASQDFSADEASEQFDNPIQYTISLENLPDADADKIIVWTFGSSADIAENAQTQLNNLFDEPLWQALGAVQNGEVYNGGSYWIGSGIYAAHNVLDDLFTFVAEVDPAEVSPNPLLTE